MNKKIVLISILFGLVGIAAPPNNSSILLGQGVTYGAISTTAQLKWLQDARSRVSEGITLISNFNKKREKTASDYLNVFWSYNFLKGRLQVDADWVRVTFGHRIRTSDSDFLLQVANGNKDLSSTYPNPLEQRLDIKNYEWLNQFHGILSDLIESTQSTQRP